MANENAPNGLKPQRKLGGGDTAVSGGYTIASGLAEDLFSGMRVKRTGVGLNIVTAAAADLAIGVFQGVRYIDQRGQPQFARNWVSGTVATDIEVFVQDDPEMVFEVQCDTLAEADIGKTANMNGVTGSAVSGNSTAFLVASTAINDGRTLRILRKVDRPDNEYGAYCRAEVISTGAGVAGTGGL